MSSFSSPSSLTIQLNFRRKSFSESTNTSMNDYMHSAGDAVPYSSPLPESWSLLAPLHLTRQDECTEWKAGESLYDTDEAEYNHHHKYDDATYPWPRRTSPLPHICRPLPSLMTKFTAHTLQSDSLPYSPSPLSYAQQTTYLYPQVDSAIADDGEEYDLESMDIHIRETYFATSAERGRWLSSPIAPRMRSQAVPPMRGYSSPIKSRAEASPMREQFYKGKSSHSVDEQIFISSSEDRDEDMCCSSPLPPSSPLTSPISNLSFLSDDCERYSAVDPCLNSDGLHSLTGTPELSSSSTTCTSPVEPTCTPIPHEAPATVPAHQLTNSPYHPTRSIISRHTSLCSPKPVDVYVPAPNVTDPEPLSPLSQFELDLPETEPRQLPLSDTVNMPCPETTVDAGRNHDVPQSIRSRSMNLSYDALDLSLDIVGGSSSEKKQKKRGGAAGNSGTKRRRKHAGTLSEGSSSDTKKRSGMESHLSNHSELPNKRPKSSHRKDDLKSCGAKTLARRRRCSLPPSCPAAEGFDSGSACSRNIKILKPTERAERQQPTPPIPMYAVDSEFHASLTGMLIEALATSRATSMDASALYLVLKQAHPYLVVERSKAELLADMAAVLETGRTRCGMFEKVDCSGERRRDRAFESRWFYVPERDADRERASLISAIMPRQKRNETKKYKQYYYRPLDKISRWDSEDAP